MGKIIQELQEQENAVNTFILLFLRSLTLQEAVVFLHSHNLCELTQSSLAVAGLGYRCGVTLVTKVTSTSNTRSSLRRTCAAH